jgi:hypothetical protein
VIRYIGMHNHRVPFYNVYVIKFGIFKRRNEVQGR